VIDEEDDDANGFISQDEFKAILLKVRLPVTSENLLLDHPLPARERRERDNRLKAQWTAPYCL
jgi:hypothetical protein